MSGPNGEPAVNVEREEDDVSAEEYDALNLMLDQISSCLDNLEEKNDVLNAKFQELLESNRQARVCRGTGELEPQAEERRLDGW
ncbi:bublin coiled-coil protein isoform X2 [Narcine bancroftii]|uniref:bublin coiled-coil protein isoform X2 n=1 Tax=Narcine bancroftii TaxID=1343680 RepID=UPI0038321D20